MRRLVPTSPQVRAVVALVAVMGVAVAVLGVLSTGGSGERARVGTDDEVVAADATTSTTRARATTPPTVLGEVIERDDVEGDAAADGAPPVVTTTTTTTPTTTAATAPPPTTQPPATQPPATAPPTTAAPTTTTTTTTTQPDPGPVSVEVIVEATSADPIVVELGGAASRQATLSRSGGSTTFADLPPGTYHVTVTTTTAPPEDQADPEVGPATNVSRSPDAQVAPGERLLAVYDGQWAMVLS